MSRMCILKRSISMVRAGLVFLSALSPAHATYQHHTASVFPDLPISATADRDSAALTSHLPWLAPVGHRQPHQADVPEHEAVSAWERQQQQADQELDRKLIICHGC
jgi:hypothetical protein